MENFKTLKSFLHTLDLIEHQSLDSLKGIEKLSKEEYEQLGVILAGIGNELSDLKDMLEENKKIKIKFK